MRCFRIGQVTVSLETNLRRVMQRYVALYERFETAPTSRTTVRTTVDKTSLAPLHRWRYQVTVNDRTPFGPVRAIETLPAIEWAVNWALPRAMPETLQLHASSMDCNGCGVIFAGHSGSGKSTLAAALTARGWGYLCDEFALIDPDTLCLHPFPRGICIKEPAFPVIESLGVSVPRRLDRKGSKGQVWFLDSERIRPHSVGAICPVRHVIFPKFVPGARPVLKRISRSEAALGLYRMCFNVSEFHGNALDAVVATVRQASCHMLISGAIGRTCDLIENQVECDLAAPRACA